MIPTLTEPEITVFSWLSSRKIPFYQQFNMFGGTNEAGGARVDFYLSELNIIIRVQSYWHTLEGEKAKDTLQEIALTNEGFTVVDVWDTDLKANPDEVMRLALRGIEIPH